MDNDYNPLNDKNLNPFQRLVVYYFIEDQKSKIDSFRTISFLVCFILPYLSVGLAWLIRLTEIQLWFYEHTIIRFLCFWVCIGLTMCFPNISDGNKTSISKDLWMLLAIILMSFIMVLFGESTFNVLSQALVFSNLFVVIRRFLSKEFENEMISKTTIIVLTILPILYFMGQEGVIQIEEGVLVYQINSLFGHILVCGYCICSVYGLKNYSDFRDLFCTMNTPTKESLDEESYNIYWKIRYMILAHPNAFGAYIGFLYSIRSLAGDSIKDMDRDIINTIAPKIKEESTDAKSKDAE